jgi:ketosteroid isomerase-like protein
MKLWSRKKIMGEMTPTGLEKEFETLLNAYKKNFANMASRKTEILNVKIQADSSEMAFAFSNATTRQTMKSGNIQNIDSAFMTIWAKESGEWKLVHLVKTVQPKSTMGGFGTAGPKPKLPEGPIFTLPEAKAITAVQKAAVENAVKEKVKQLYASFDSMNVEAYEKLWSRDKIIGILTPTVLIKDFNIILTRFKTNFLTEKSHQNEILDIKIQALSPEMAFAFGKTNIRIVRMNGNIMNYSSTDMTIWIKDSGEWKMTYFANSAEEKK